MALRHTRLKASLSTRTRARTLTASKAARSLRRSAALLAADLSASNPSTVSRAVPLTQGEAIADA
jgi:hypothetical protein